MPTYLKEARVKAGYSIEDISEKLKIRKKYLLALEEGNFGEIPGDTYAKGYLRLYENYLDLGNSSLMCHTLEAPAHNDALKQAQDGKHILAKIFPLVSGLMLVLILIIYYVVLIPGQF